METVAISIGLFLISFTVQAIVWRIRLPRKQIPALLALFVAIPLAITGAALRSGKYSVAPEDFFRLALLYTSSVLAYAIIYSALEAQSPTLRLIAFVRMRGDRGCPEEELVEEFGNTTTIDDRIDAILRGGWARLQGEKLVLTRSGAFYATLFTVAARFFGLPKGG